MVDLQQRDDCFETAYQVRPCKTTSLWELFNTSCIQAIIFAFQNSMLRPDKIIQAIPNSNQNNHSGKLRVGWKFWFWVGRRYYIVNVVDYITNNEYENSSRRRIYYRIISDNRRVFIMSPARNTAIVNVDWWVSKKATKLTTCESFYLWKVWEILQKTEVLWNSRKTWWAMFWYFNILDVLCSNLNYFKDCWFWLTVSQQL